MNHEIPSKFIDLADGPRVAALTTLMPDGQPQTTVVWCDYDGEYVRVNTMRGFRKEKNMRANPKVTLLCYDPRQPLRFLEIRGSVVEMTEDGAMEHLDGLSELYTGRSPYFGQCVPAEFQHTETPVLCKVRPNHVVTLDARRKESPARKQAVRDLPPPEVVEAGFDRLDQQPIHHSREVPAWGLPVPATHLDLLTCSIHGVLTTLMPDGQPQSSLVWCDYDGECARVNTTLERQKGRNLSANPKASLLLVDPEDTSRYLEIRGEVELVFASAFQHLDEITRQYTKHPCYYGYIYPLEQRAKETRVICRIHAKKITMDAIHK